MRHGRQTLGDHQLPRPHCGVKCGGGWGRDRTPVRSQLIAEKYEKVLVSVPVEQAGTVWLDKAFELTQWARENLMRIGEMVLLDALRKWERQPGFTDSCPHCSALKSDCVKILTQYLPGLVQDVGKMLRCIFLRSASPTVVFVIYIV